MTRALLMGLAVVAALLAAGCGQKRDLVLPDAPPALEPAADEADADASPPSSAG